MKVEELQKQLADARANSNTKSAIPIKALELQLSTARHNRTTALAKVSNLQQAKLQNAQKLAIENQRKADQLRQNEAKHVVDLQRKVQQQEANKAVLKANLVKKEAQVEAAKLNHLRLLKQKALLQDQNLHVAIDNMHKKTQKEKNLV